MDQDMIFYAPKRTQRDREQGFTPLEEETRVNRAEHSAKTPDQIAKAKERRERRAKKAAAAMELDVRFAEAVAADPDKITIAALHVSQKTTEAAFGCPEKAWLERVSDKTNTYIMRKDENTLYIRGFPANLALAKAQIESDVRLPAPGSAAPAPQ
ncbi:MAG: hypothetical protein JWO78_2095 [Micavibrio sp.]|nr:hypothetical protein [Micavibrio sp.]